YGFTPSPDERISSKIRCRSSFVYSFRIPHGCHIELAFRKVGYTHRIQNIAHELGHALGLNHSGKAEALMYPWGGHIKPLDIDDKVAVSALYDTWRTVPTGNTRDVAVGREKGSPVGADGLAWMVGGTYGNNVFKQKTDGSGWVPDPWAPKASRIALNGYRPYIVTYGTGEVQRRNSGDPTINSGWSNFGGCATDVGASPAAIWIIGCDIDTYGNGSIWALGASGWIPDAAGGRAARIAVDSAGAPWVVSSRLSGGKVFRRTSSDVMSGAWQWLDACAVDIGIYEPGYAWVLGCDKDSMGNYGVYARNDNSYIGDGITPELHRWVRMSTGGGVNIAVGPNSKPWVTTFGQSVMTTVR
ncbi:MAG: matrixin family metalloprotease, partial [Polyangiaceae bacterium]|nr:matrixin family metalloprotease [Polyangiaceae bacterium]